jgi:hypothetical protein
LFVRQHRPNLRATQIHTDHESTHAVLLGNTIVTRAPPA